MRNALVFYGVALQGRSVQLVPFSSDIRARAKTERAYASVSCRSNDTRARPKSKRVYRDPHCLELLSPGRSKIMPSNKHNSVQSGEGNLGDQLRDLRQRLDRQEKEILEIKGGESGRMIDRMHELERLTREQCNSPLALARAL